MSFAMVTNQLQAKDQWVAGFSFGKWQATGRSLESRDESGLESGDDKAQRKSVVSQIKDHQGPDADLMDDASLRTLAEKQKQDEVVVNEKSVQKTLQQFFMNIFAFLYKK